MTGKWTLRAAVVLVCLLSCSLVARAADGRPNLLLAIGDNWAWPHAGALDDPTAKTPVFDRVVREGVLFTHAFCPVPSCSPTRSCILTGCAAHQLGPAASLWSAFPRELKVFTDMLRDAGYEVGFCGKGWSPGNFKDFGWQQNPVGREYQDFAEFMSQRPADKPFFFWLGDTHTALHAWPHDTASQTSLDPATVKVPSILPDVPEVRDDMLAYYAGVAALDRAVGAAIVELERAKLLEQTVVFYTSDNGWQMPRGLANCYDTGTRVPLAVRWGSRLTAGGKADEFISLTDLAPTFVELAGLKPPAEMTGRSFVDVLVGKPSGTPRDHVFLERERHANVRLGNLSYPIRGIRTQDFLYLHNLRPDRWPAGDPTLYWSVGDYGDVDNTLSKEFIIAHAAEPAIKPFYKLSFAKRPAEELYDLRKDPGQLANVADRPEFAATKRALAAQVDEWMRDTGDPRVDPSYDGWDDYTYYAKRLDATRKPAPRKSSAGNAK